jgi:DNA invertase Pin-like site-specific DNA recombinase
MPGLLIGYARVSTEEQDLTAQRDGLQRLGVEPSRIYVDHGLTGTNRDRPGLREALAACRAGDTLVVTKLDRLARSLPDARAIAEDLTRRTVRLSLGGSVYDPADPVGRLLFNVLATVAEFEADLIRSRAREGMRVAKAKGHLRGKQPKLNPRQEAHLIELCAPANTPPPNWATCSAWPAPPSTAHLPAASRQRSRPGHRPVRRRAMRRRAPARAFRRWTRRQRRTCRGTARPAPSPPRTGAVGARNNTPPEPTPHTGRRGPRSPEGSQGDSRPILPCRKWFRLRTRRRTANAAVPRRSITPWMRAHPLCDRAVVRPPRAVTVHRRR